MKNRDKYLSLPKLRDKHPPGLREVVLDFSKPWGRGSHFSSTPVSLFLSSSAPSVFYLRISKGSQRFKRIFLAVMGQPDVNQMYWSAVNNPSVQPPKLSVKDAEEQGQNFYYIAPDGHDSFLFHLTGSGNVTRFTKRPISIATFIAVTNYFALNWGPGITDLQKAARVVYR